MSQENEFRGLVAELKSTIETELGKVGTLEQKQSEYSAEFKQKFEEINDRLDAFEFEAKTNAEVDPELKKSEVVKEFKDIFNDFSTGQNRKSINEREVKTAYHPSLAKSNDLVRFDFAGAGALLLPAQISEEIIKNVTEFTPAMRLARVTTTNRSEYKRRVRTSTAGGRWLAEAVKNDKGKPEYGEISIPPQKWASYFGWSIEQAQDTGYDLVGELNQSFREDFSVDMGNAFLNGDGVGKPTGMVGRITNFDAGQLAIDPSDLIRMQEELKEDYHANAQWLFTRKTRAYIRTLFLTSNNAALQYLWEPSFKAGIPTLLLGAPVNIAREGDLAGVVTGNFTLGQVYAIYGDFNQGYEVAMHTDMFAIDDPYSESDAFIRNLHIMTRVGGNVIKPEALVQITAAGS